MFYSSRRKNKHSRKSMENFISDYLNLKLSIKEGRYKNSQNKILYHSA